MNNDPKSQQLSNDDASSASADAWARVRDKLSKGPLTSPRMSPSHRFNPPLERPLNPHKLGHATTFSELPADVHIAIAEACTWEDLSNLCSITRWMHKSCVHVLYREVDLSVHNKGIVDMQINNETVQFWSDNSDCNIHHEALKKKQTTFLETLTRHPEFAVHIHKLSWSMFVSRDSEETLTTTWKVFNMMTNLRHIDIAGVQDAHFLYFHKDSMPSTLFASVTSASLGGIMARPLPQLILKSLSLSNLQHLTINNLQESGEFGWDTDPGTYDTDRTTPPVKIRQPPRATLGLLAKLTGKCTALKTLTLRKVAKGVEHPFDNTLFKSEDQVYPELAAFIKSLGPTLEKLTFEQGPPAFAQKPADADHCKDHATNWDGVGQHNRAIILSEQEAAKAMGEWAPRSGGSYRPMDLAFAMTILPAIVETEWHFLKEVRVLGVGAWDAHWTGLAADVLLRLGPDVSVSVLPDSRTFELAGMNEAMRPT